jgi:hypothetical protein
MPSRHGPIEPRRLEVTGQKQQLEGVGERHLRQLCREAPGCDHVPASQGSPKLRVHPALSRHEHMFA